MRFDFHVHALLSRAIPFKLLDLNAMVAQGKLRGLDGFALTEHINAPGYWSIYELLRETYLYKDGIYEIEPGFCIINGAEISLMHGGDLIALGEPESIRRIDMKLKLSKGFRPSLPDLLRAVPQDIVLIGAHPFRPMGGLLKFDQGCLKRLTAIEVNGKDIAMADQVREVADDLGLALVGGSDAHYWPQVGISSTILPIDQPDIGKMKEAILGGTAEVWCAQDANRVVEMCNAYKRRIKEEFGLPRSANKVRQLQLTFN